jgi:hypothetical protein
MKTNSLRTRPLCVVALSAIAAIACDRRSDTSSETQTTGATHPPTVEKVKDEPSKFYGKRVTLSGEVDSPKADSKEFTLEGNAWIFDREIRVLTKSPVKIGGAPLADDDHVVVTGTVRPFVVADVEREIGWDLSPELEVELREKPVLVADEIRRVEPSATWTEKKPQGEIVGLWLLVTTPTPQALVGQPVNAEKLKVHSVTKKGFFVGPSHAEQTFVLASDASALEGIKPGDLVDVRGTVKKTPPVDTAMKDFGLAPTLRSVVEREPLYVEAKEIKRSAEMGTKGKNEKE